MLVVLQALDAAGKDGTIRHVMSGVNPQGVSVHSFKVPSAEELDHDYLWRYARQLPRRGEIGIFNRSHYEEVLVVRVHPENLDRQRLPSAARKRDVWKRRYREINDWERYLTDNGFRIVKLFLNLSQGGAAHAGSCDGSTSPITTGSSPPPTSRSASTGTTTRQAFSEMLSHTSTEWAPWYVIPADRKWFGRIGAAAVLVHALMEIDPRFPAVAQAAARGAARGQARARGAGAGGRRARPVRAGAAKRERRREGGVPGRTGGRASGGRRRLRLDGERTPAAGERCP